ncbi:butyrate kinase [Cloacibacillus sp. An23]|uniref:butyrate kinase n=1 Tax=Cloacibacillus sp. An23 TaxID=1965591 RepID=UPI000B366D12|nr:butyrate kinase [Cloacibacillus sp. An23]OUO94078.1 butyrate kinase [Cloacibacillus sp. An23]
MLIFAADPGSTSTKTAVYEDERQLFEKSLPFSDAERARYSTILAQLPARCAAIEAALGEAGFGGRKFDAAVGRGGLLAPVPSGTYLVNGAMTDWLTRAPRGEHASNLGPFIARRFAEKSGAPAYIVDPVSVDELSDVARISGAPEIERGSLVHALNQRATARKAAAALGKRYEDCRFVVAHLGTGVTIGAHENGRIADVIGAKADGPFSAERAGGLPADALVELCFSGKYTEAELRVKLLSGWGFVSYLGTRDLREIFALARRDERAALVLDAFVYQTAKGIGELAAALDGDVDAVILTGGMANSAELVSRITKKIKFLGNVIALPGENELEALAFGALRVLRGEERVRNYPDGAYL